MFQKKNANHFTHRKTHVARSIAALGLAVALGACTTEGATPENLVGEATVEAFPTINIEPTLDALPTVDTSPDTGVVPTVVAEPTVGTSGTTTGEALQVSEIMSDPDAYIGQQVTVIGEAQQVFGSSAFKLDEDSFFGAGIDNDLLVVSGQENNPAVDDGWLDNVVRVTGTVQRYVKADFDRDYNWVTLSPEIETDFEGQIALVADSVTVVDEDTSAVAPAINDEEIEGAPAGTLRVSQVTGDLSAYVGQTVTVQGEAQEFYSQNVFKMDDDSVLTGGIDNDLLVIGAEEARPTMDNGLLNSQVRVTGVVQEFDRARVEQEVGYGLDDVTIVNNWDGLPVLIADSVEVVQ